MEGWAVWLPITVAVLALGVAFIAALREHPQEPIDLQGVLDATEAGIDYAATEGEQFIGQIAPAAKEFVRAVRQKYLNGELELDELKPVVMAQLEALFPQVDKERLEMALEGAVFAVKLVAKGLWHKPSDTNRDGGVDNTQEIPTAVGASVAEPSVVGHAFPA